MDKLIKFKQFGFRRSLQNDLQNVLDKVENNNGKIIVPKTEISPEMGYFGMFIDTEGNKIAVHSIS